MRYICNIIINASLEKVTTLFLEHMVVNKNKVPGSTTTFTYNFGNNQEMKMKETIESIDMPHEIITIYEVEGVWNRCINQFRQEGKQVIFTMDTEFIFYNEMNVNEEKFRNKTQRQMEEFKKLVEEKL
ncbi:MAG TPA: hypothetical protein VIK84_06715 [Haloplasmataceae bacterium]